MRTSRLAVVALLAGAPLPAQVYIGWGARSAHPQCTGSGYAVLASSGDLRAQGTDETAIVLALDRWIRAYSRDEIDLTNDGPARLRLPRALVATGEPPGELLQFQQLVTYAAETESAAAVDRLVYLLDLSRMKDGTWKWDYPVLRDVVGRVFEAASPRIVRRLVTVALDRAGSNDGLRLAAVEALGRTACRSAAEELLPLLADQSPGIRAGVVATLARIGEPATVRSIAMMLHVEDDSGVVQAATAALEGFLRSDAPGSVNGETLSAAILAAATALRRAQTSAELLQTSGFAGAVHLVRFLERHPGKEGALALVELLEWLQLAVAKKPAEARRLRDLRVSARSALRSMTGAVVADDDDAGWRKWWDATGGEPALVSRNDPAKSASETVAPSRTGGGFFDIPVRGRRVVFLIDVSGSMGDTALRNPTRKLSRPNRFDVAKREVVSAVEGLEEDTLFSVVVFAAQARPFFKSHLVPATRDNKDVVSRFLADFPTRGSTALWDGLKLATSLTVDGGDVLVEPVDEVLVVTDGRVTDPGKAGRAVIELARTLGIRISTVAVGRSAEGAVLAAVAKGTGGTFVTFDI